MKQRGFVSVWLFLILFLAFLLRFWHLDQNPPSLTWDEVAWGYNAYSLGLTARDEFGRLLPYDYLESFGDFKPPVYAYLTILPITIFGLNPFAVRFPSALLGTLTVLLTYFLVRELFPPNLEGNNRSFYFFTSNQLVALTASFLLAISPWHIMLSRAAFEANVAQFFLVGGVTFFLIGRRRSWCFFLSSLFFFLSLQTFNTARIVSPLLVLGLVLGFRREVLERKRWFLPAFLFGLCLLLPIVPFYLSPQARLRFKEVNIFSNLEVIKLANQQMANDGWVFWSRILHNRRWLFFQNYLQHYFDHFNPTFLFIKGDGNPKFSTQDVGQLYLWELPFLLFGILLLFDKRPEHWWLLPFWLLLGIAPAATARETPHALRIETTLPCWQILSALGFVGFRERIERAKWGKFAFFLCFFSITLFFVYFQHGYWFHYPYEFSGEWQYGYREAVKFVKEVEDRYDQVWFTTALGRPYIYFLFYLRYPPEKFWQEARVEREPFGFVKVRGFGKYNFRKHLEFDSKGKVLYIDLPENLPPQAKILKTFFLLNGKKILVAFEV